MSDKNINRKDFLKSISVGAVATVAGATMAGCEKKEGSSNVAGGSTFLGEVPTDKMTYRTSKTGDKVSLLGYGCMRWSTKTDASGATVIDQDLLNDLVDYAIAHGVNYFDTAPVYVQAQSEAATGMALQRHPRDKFYVATKLSNMQGPYTLANAKAMYESSFKNLQVDYFDYYLLHNLGGGSDVAKARWVDNGVIDFMLKEKEKGKIRNLGWSFHGNLDGWNYMLNLGVEWDFVQIQMNYSDWIKPQRGEITAKQLYDDLTERNIPVVIMEPLLGGRLARMNAVSYEKLRQVHPNDNPAAWAFRFCGSQPNVLTVLSGMTYMEHLQENIRSLSPLEPLTDYEYEVLEEAVKIASSSDYIQCTKCQYCMPCPYGLDIPEIFAHYNKCVEEDKILKHSTDEGYKKARREFLIGYDRSVPKLRQANHCIHCGSCIGKCPQNLNIIDNMEKVDKYVELLKQKAEF